MKRATITLPDDLEAELDAFMAEQDPAPSLTRLVQTALRLFLEVKQREQALNRRDLVPARTPLRVSVAARGSGEHDISIEHDRHLAAEP